MRLLSVSENIIDRIHLKLKGNHFLLLSSVLVGLTAGFAAVLLKTFVHLIHRLVHSYSESKQIIYALLPLLGILLTVLFVKHFLKGKLGKGTANIIYSIVKRSGFLPKDQMYSHIITSGLTVGFGGSAGLESPIVTTGASIGSNFSKRYKLSYKERILLLACGSAAGIAAIFNSPIAGVLFSVEVLLIDISISSFIPLLMSAAAGALFSKIILQEEMLFSFSNIQPFNYTNVIYYVFLGTLCGFLSIYYHRMFLKVEDVFKKYKKNSIKRLAIGGALLTLLIMMFPPLFGEGYESIKLLSGNSFESFFGNTLFGYIQGPWIMTAFIFAVMMVKVFATALTITSGGNGGNFAPSLFVGAYLGYLFSHTVNLSGVDTLPVSNFILVAMCGVLTGVFHAPLTGIFLIAEITGGYELMIPLMIVSAISYTVVKYFEPLSMDSKALSKKAKIYRDDRDKTILSSLNTSPLVETDFHILSQKMNLRELVEVLSHSKRNIFPVVDETKCLIGIVTLDNVREIMFKVELYEKVVVRELMTKPAEIISIDEDMHTVMRKFDKTETWNLPVVQKGVYIGFISKSSLLTQYRSHLIESSLN